MLPGDIIVSVNAGGASVYRVLYGCAAVTGAERAVWLTLHCLPLTLALCACYTGDDITTTGWSYLNIESNPSVSVQAQAFAAGFLEGGLTAERIYQFKENILPLFNGSSVWSQTLDYLANNTQYTQQMIEANPFDPFWVQVDLVWNQLLGMAAGVASTGSTVTYQDLLLLNAQGDIGDIESTVTPREQRLNLRKQPLSKLLEWRAENEHCSAMIRLTEGNQELMMGHTTWGHYSTMLRVFKRYTLFSGSNVAADTVQFSSYPGVLDSNDDFYTMSPSMLAVTETTLDVYNPYLYDQNSPQSVLTWQRVIVANRLANNGSEWVSLFGRQNSGSYNNEW